VHASTLTRILKGEKLFHTKDHKRAMLLYSYQ